MELHLGKKYYINQEEDRYDEANLIEYKGNIAKLEFSENSYIETSIYNLFETEEELLNFKEELEEAVERYAEKLNQFTDMFDDLVDEFGGKDGYNSDDILDYIDMKYGEVEYKVVKDKINYSTTRDKVQEIKSYYTVIEFEIDCICVDWEGNTYGMGLKVFEPFEFEGEKHFRSSNYWSEPNRYKNNKIKEYRHNYRKNRIN